MMSKSPFDFNIQTKKIDNSNNKRKKFIANKNETTLTFCICLYIHWTFAYFPYCRAAHKKTPISISQFISCVFASKLKRQFILLFSLFMLLFMGSTAFFGTIHESHGNILTNFYLYLKYF